VSELHHGTETAEPATLAPEAADGSGYGEAGLGAEHDGDIDALAAGGRLPPRQDSHAATWGDNPVYDDEVDLGAEYDGDLEALTGQDQLAPRQDSHAVTWGEHAEYDEADLGAEYDGDIDALAAGGRLPPRQDSRTATWGDDPVYDDEVDLGAEYDGDLEALTAEDRSRDAAVDHTLDNSPREASTRDGSGDEAADRQDHGGDGSPTEAHITHYQASFRGEQLDLWTDGQGRWASDYKPTDDALPVDHLADVRSRMGPEAMPATEFADGHAIEVTRDPRDGVWIPGLPGKVPDEVGDVLASSETHEEKRSRSRDFTAEVTREAEHVFDETKESSELVYKELHHPPEGKAEVPVPAHGPELESTPHEPDAGGMMTGVLAAGIAVWILREKFHEWRTRGKAGAGHASDG
jgi:hypothetical protein